jgi:D-serine deaminase-like pyridoxal phosphate-dependent protein
MEKAGLSTSTWYNVDNVKEVNSPSLLLYPERIEYNIRRMIGIAGGPEYLRPHVKTHKIPEIVKLQMNHGIGKFKCATISETEMVARCGATDILLAVQPVGPNQSRFFQLKKEFPLHKISCIADSEEVITQLSELAAGMQLETNIWLDINCGMNRTGISPGTKAEKLYRMILQLPFLKAEGLHVYDGHIHETDFSKRQEICADAFIPVERLIYNLKNLTADHIKVVAGGTPTFPVHALRKGFELSPGTLLLWDYGYSQSFKDMDFIYAAVLLTRIISKPGKDLLCLDLGHKSVASEMPQPRVKILGLDNYVVIGHNEEHMVLSTPEADKFNIGDPLYGIPWHICPTVDRYDYVNVVCDHKVNEQWVVEARKRKITI